jgi:hypothetical protein
MIRPRKTLRRGEPTPAEKQEARIRCCRRANATCEKCERFVPLGMGHLHHEHSKRRFGWMESDHQRHIWLCGDCHHDTHNPKPCPPKS